MRLRISDYVAAGFAVCAIVAAWRLESLLWPSVFIVAAMTVILWAGAVEWFNSLDRHYESAPREVTHRCTMVNPYRFVCECGLAGSERWALIHEFGEQPTQAGDFQQWEEEMKPVWDPEIWGALE